MTKTTAHKRAFFLSSISAILALIYADVSCTEDGTSCASETPLGRYPTWEEAPSSTEEFDHDNDKSVCRLPIISVEEWEEGRFWEGEEPVLVRNVTDGWPALEHWTK